jgi:hypothetical protein
MVSPEWGHVYLKYVSDWYPRRRRIRLRDESVKNCDTGCDGLSPGLFVFAIMGNLTYALSICVSSMDMGHLMVNASWLGGKLSVNHRQWLKRLVGSLLTIFFDVFVSGRRLYILQGLTGRGGRCSYNLDTIEGSGVKSERREPGGEEGEGSCNLPRCGPRVPRVPSFLPRRSTLQLSTSAPPPEPGHAVGLVRVIIIACNNAIHRHLSS